MLNNLYNNQKDAVTRHYHKVAAFAVLIFGLGIIIWLNWPQISGWLAPTVAIAPGPDEIINQNDDYLDRAAPIEIRIPEVGIEAKFEAPLELNDDGTIQVPESFDKVGWYKLGAAPGEVGTATVLGHVDSYEGPEVFYPLGRLETGDRIYIDRGDGKTAVFEVEKLERYSQDNFPAEKVYTMTDYPSLRLITCTGTYDHGEQRYSHNLVVFAKFVSGGDSEEIETSE